MVLDVLSVPSCQEELQDRSNALCGSGEALFKKVDFVRLFLPLLNQGAEDGLLHEGLEKILVSLLLEGPLLDGLENREDRLGQTPLVGGIDPAPESLKGSIDPGGGGETRDNGEKEESENNRYGFVGFHGTLRSAFSI